jgi:NlpC/P60 family putative phage cell wall peptidase
VTLVERHALAWLGTPYRHGAALRGAGCDCLGLLRGLHGELLGEVPAAPPYSPDWAEASGQDLLIEGLGRFLHPIDLQSAAGGDVVVFRLRRGVAAKHAAILIGDDGMIHAHERASVALVPFSLFWRRRLAAAFRFPIAVGDD